MKEAIAIVVASMLIAGALIFHGYQTRYAVAGVGGLVVRIDTWSGKISACAQVETTGGTVVDARMKVLAAAGFTSDEIAKYFVEHEGEMFCSRWSD